ncbi:hypothetical protein ACFYOG_37550 [Streptomyces sp. NPDC007818]|uniref:hypothetical protein n=1 Tax=Streptomyces sp. NPDC007818 TaxID=3364780 RepID=UPI0036A2E084
MPVYDRVVRCALGHPPSFWTDLRTAGRRDGPETCRGLFPRPSFGRVLGRHRHVRGPGGGLSPRDLSWLYGGGAVRWRRCVLYEGGPGALGGSRSRGGHRRAYVAAADRRARG